MREPIPNKLKELRKRANLTQAELASKLEFTDSQDRICHWEKGTALPSIPNLFKLSRFYDISPYDIYPSL